MSREVVPSVVEYVSYGLLLYSLMPFTQGLSIRMLVGGTYAALAAFCMMRFGLRAIAPIAIPLSCGTSFVALQILVHGESLMAAKAFVIWMLQLIVVQSLYLRQGFLHRFAWAALIIGLLLLPYLDYYDVSRAGLEGGVALSDPNALGHWFGFVCVYFMVAGIEAKRPTRRIACWLVGIGCFYVLGLTVSRGALLATVIPTIVALRHLLKRGFLPILTLLLLAWILYTTGIFEQSAASYAARATEETGRWLVWPLVIERFLSSPLIGVGAAKVGTYVSTRGPITPHNSFLYIALASGIIPLMFFMAYWWRAARGALRLSGQPAAYAPFVVPLLIYTFLSAQDTNVPFMEMWAIVSLSMTMAPSAPGQVRRIRSGRTIEHSGRWREARYGIAGHRRFVRPARS